MVVTSVMMEAASSIEMQAILHKGGVWRVEKISFYPECETVMMMMMMMMMMGV